MIPDGCTTIGAKAFAGCAELELVIVPNSVTTIAADAFEGCGDVTFICQSNSAAAAYAAGHDNITCVNP